MCDKPKTTVKRTQTTVEQWLQELNDGRDHTLIGVRVSALADLLDERDRYKYAIEELQKIFSDPDYNHPESRRWFQRVLSRLLKEPY